MEPARKRMPDGTVQHIGEPQKSESFTFRMKDVEINFLGSVTDDG